MAIRLLLVSHAATAAMRAARFPADDALDSRGLGDIELARERLVHALADALADAEAEVEASAVSFVSPARCARETARALGLTPSIVDALADVDYGSWRGLKLAEVAAATPQALASWTQDPDARPPGGESFSELVQRVGTWLDALTANDTPRAIAVTHAWVMRAAIVHALGVPSSGFARIEIAPLSVVELRRTVRGWTWWPAQL